MLVPAHASRRRDHPHAGLPGSEVELAHVGELRWKSGRRLTFIRARKRGTAAPLRSHAARRRRAQHRDRIGVGTWIVQCAVFTAVMLREFSEPPQEVHRPQRPVGLVRLARSRFSATGEGAADELSLAPRLGHARATRRSSASPRGRRPCARSHPSPPTFRPDERLGRPNVISRGPGANRYRASEVGPAPAIAPTSAARMQSRGLS